MSGRQNAINKSKSTVWMVGLNHFTSKLFMQRMNGTLAHRSTEMDNRYSVTLSLISRLIYCQRRKHNDPMLKLISMEFVSAIALCWERCTLRFFNISRLSSSSSIVNLMHKWTSRSPSFAPINSRCVVVTCEQLQLVVMPWAFAHCLRGIVQRPSDIEVFFFPFPTNEQHKSSSTWTNVDCFCFSKKIGCAVVGTSMPSS